MGPKIVLAPRIVLAVIDHKPTPQDIVTNNEAARAQKAFGLTWLRLLQDSGKIRWVSRLLGINEDDIVGLLVLELW